MARGSARAPSQHAYRGSVGRTTTATVHVTGPSGDLSLATIHTAIDAVSDPELAARMLTDEPTRALNMHQHGSGEPIRIDAPVLYHDPAAEVLVLVLAEAHRHRELDERIAVLERLRADDTPIPAYAKDFAVVFGAVGLRTYLEEQAQRALAAADTAGRDAELDRVRRELDTARADATARAAQIDRLQLELEATRSEARTLAAAARASERALAPPVEPPAPARRDDNDEPDTGVKIPRPHDGVRTADAIAVPESPAMFAIPSPTPRSEAVTSPAIPAPHLLSPLAQELLGDVLADDPAELPALGGLRAHTNGHANGHANGHDSHNGHGKPSDAGDEVVEDDVIEVVFDVSQTGPRDKVAAGVADADADAEEADALEALEAHPAETGSHTIEIEDDSSSGSGVGDQTGPSIIPAGADPLTTSTEDLSLDDRDAWLEHELASTTSTLGVSDVGVRLSLVVGETLARSFGGQLDVRVLLHRMPTYPLVTLVLGPPAAFRVPSVSQLAVIPLDIGAELDREALASLGKQFALAIDLITRGEDGGNGRRVRRVRLTAPLAENVRYMLRTAEDHRRAITSDGSEASYARAAEAVLARDYDLLGARHVDAAEFRDDRLAQLDSAQSLRRAIAMAKRFARPSREDYLVCVRGFPLPRWRELRHHVLESAVTWGLWMGSELAQIAVAEGLARSRRDLVGRLEAGFEALRQHPEAFDIDDDACDDNLKAIADEAKLQHVELRTHTKVKSGPIASADVPVVAGSIEQPTATVTTIDATAGVTVEELIGMLDDRRARVAAAIELCERGDGRAAAAVVGAVRKMSRAEAVRVLGMSVRFGDAAAPPLIEGLGSSKAFLRHGCALALALLRTQRGTIAVTELLVREPTEIWREVARAIGQVGPEALMPLAACYGGLGELATPAVQERVAWAMAHIGVRGGAAAIEAMAAGSSRVAPVATKALELLASAARDQVRVKAGADGSQPGRDVTVNRAFSRRFFESLEQGIPHAGAAGLEDMDASGPMEMLDESDLLDEHNLEPAEATELGDDDEAVLDESDMIQT